MDGGGGGAEEEQKTEAFYTSTLDFMLGAQIGFYVRNRMQMAFCKCNFCGRELKMDANKKLHYWQN